MRSGCNTWPARLIATVATLALVVACTLGAYAHAAGHRHHSAGHASQGVAAHGAFAENAPGQVHSAHGHVAHTHVGHTHVGRSHAGHNVGHSHAGHNVGHSHAGHDGGDADKSNADCCNALCHCAHAILAAAPVIPHLLLAAPPMQAEVSLDSAVVGGLERPPRTSVPA